MEPVTHVLTGAVLARAGLNRRTAYAAVAMAIAAEFPDIDVLWGFGGPVTSLEHHRGITHTFVALPFEAALVTAAFYGIHRLRRSPSNNSKAHWGWLFAGTLLALLSHLLLDWTNNYGLRPFFPFDPHWYAGSFVFIFEPLLFVILVAALVLPALFGLINSEVGTRRALFRGRGSAWVALVLVAGLYLFRWNEHAKALRLAAADAPPAEPVRVFASPHPLDPFLWHTVTDTPESYLLSTIDTRTGLTEPHVPSDTLYKAPSTLAIMAAKRTYLGRIYLDWSPYPVLAESADTSDPNHPLTRVTFTDARFLYNVSLLKARDHAPLSGSVTLDMAAPTEDRVVEMKMDGRLQK